MFLCVMRRFYDREEYLRMYKEFEAEGDLDSALLARSILRKTRGASNAYYERDFWYYQPCMPFHWYYQPAMPFPGNEM